MIRPVNEADLAAIDAALRSLGHDLGDPYRADLETLKMALFGPHPSAWALIADGPTAPRGIAVFSPVFSTVRGGAGVYVSDLWVSGDERGNGLGSSLLQATAEQAGSLWGAIFMRLAVYDHNTAARALYDRLGFEPAGPETTMVITGQAFEQMRRPR